MQTTNGTMAIVPPVTKNNRNEADNAYYQTLAAAAVSKVPIHAVAMLDSDGTPINHACYFHGGDNE